MKNIKLTPGEDEVLRFLVLGKSNKDIAATLCRSEKAIKTRITGLFKKLGVKTRLEAVAKYHNYDKALPRKGIVNE